FSNKTGEEDFLSLARTKLDNLVSEVEKESIPLGLKSGVGIIQEGKTVNTIVEYAEQHAVDLILMGTEGVNDFKKNYIGTRSSQVIERATQDVFIIPRKVFFKPPRKLVYATDYIEEDKLAIQKVVKL